MCVRVRAEYRPPWLFWPSISHRESDAEVSAMAVMRMRVDAREVRVLPTFNNHAYANVTQGSMSGRGKGETDSQGELHACRYRSLT